MKWLGVVVGCLTLFGPSFADAGPDLEALETTVLNPSRRCGQCHEDIYAMWRRSMHGIAATDPVFVASYDQAYRETQGQAEKLCLRCHAPMAFHSGNLTEEARHEGISCDYCHSIVEVDLARKDSPIRIALDGVKRGPIRSTESPAHEVRESELHQSAELCAGCHEYENPRGIAILSTYSEWQRSPQAAEGMTCQHCHMPVTEGETVSFDLAPSRGGINLHDVSGGHSAEQVAKAAALRIVRIERTNEVDVLLEIEVANVGSGHSIPTGMPTRRLELEVMLFQRGRMIKTFKHNYQRRLVDENRRLITEDHATMLYAHGLLEDNRLMAGEKRVEKFLARNVPKGPLRVEAKLHYVYEPKVLVPQRMSIEMAAAESP